MVRRYVAAWTAVLWRCQFRKSDPIRLGVLKRDGQRSVVVVKVGSETTVAELLAEVSACLDVPQDESDEAMDVWLGIQARGALPMGPGIISGSIEFEEGEARLALESRGGHSEAACTSLAAQWRRVLAVLEMSRERKVADLPFLEEGERRRLLDDFNPPPMAGSDEVYPSVFRSVAAAQAKRIAVRCEGEALSYAEIDMLSDALAAEMNGLGVRPGLIVGIAMDRSLDMMVAMLSSFKVGAAYLPLALDYPKERLEWMLEDANVSLVLRRANDRVLDFGVRTHDVALASLAADPSAATRLPGASALSSAYVIYTSGSTGRPKGVPITHQALLLHNRAVVKAYELCSEDVVLQFASVSFDISVEEIFPTWLAGATLLLRPRS